MHARSMGRSIEIISLKVSLLPVHGAYVKNAALGKRYKTFPQTKNPDKVVASAWGKTLESNAVPKPDGSGIW